MHGVGYPFILEACKAFGFCEPIPVVEQVSLYREWWEIFLFNPFNSIIYRSFYIFNIM